MGQKDQDQPEQKKSENGKPYQWSTDHRVVDMTRADIETLFSIFKRTQACFKSITVDANVAHLSEGESRG